MSVIGAMSDVVTAPLRRLARAIVAPSDEERPREVDTPLRSREERAEAGRRGADAHLRERDARRARLGGRRERAQDKR